MFTLAGYEINNILNQGDQTTVYQICIKGQRLVLKLLQSEYPTLEASTRLKHEYQIQKDLEHPHIVKAIKLETFDHRLGILLEDFGGESLAQLHQQQKLDIISCLTIAIQITKALDYLHSKEIIHKDIKPSNVIINAKTGLVKITDFGIASRLNKENLQFTNPNSVEGTLAYMSGEQTGRMNRALDYRTDFYSLGVSLYEILTGKLPFVSQDPLEIVYSHIAIQAIPPQQVNSDIPTAISDIVMKLMAKNAEDRYQSATGLLVDLETCLQQLQTQGEIRDFIPGKLDNNSQLLIPQKLYGREEQVNQILAGFERISQGNSELILVSGYSGIGKSAVVNEVNKPITRKRGYFISGKFDQFKRNIPYVSIIQAFKSLMNLILQESAEELEKWRQQILTVVGINGQVIIDIIPELELIIGQQPEVSPLPPIEAQNRFYRVFKEFLHVFTTHDHPLVIFLDDLQWADKATLKLIELLTIESDTKYLLIIGAYRDNEVSPVHPLMQTVVEIESSGTFVNKIELKPLNINDITNLLWETLKSKQVKILAELFFNKTGGNPFFLTQLLQVLYENKLLKFDFYEESWQWSLSEIQSIGIIDKSVVELVASRIEKLPQETQYILKLAACIGDKFTLEVLSTVNQKSSTETAIALYLALQQGLILPLSEAYKIPLVFQEEKDLENSFDTSRVNYKFLHDRVQQAAYSLIPESEKQTTHLNIGRLLLKNTPPSQRESNIFDIVNQLNVGVEILTQKSEKLELAELNLIAGKKAKAAAAYETMYQYLRTGVGLLNSDTWETNYNFALSLYELAAEATCLNGDFQTMELWANIILQKADTLLDKITIYEIKILAAYAQKKVLECVEIGLEVLNLLELNFSIRPTQAEVEQKLAETDNLISNYGIENLVNLPQIEDAKAIASLRILNMMLPAVNATSPLLYAFISALMVNLIITYGNHPLSAIAYASYGAVLCTAVNNIELGYKLGQTALSLLTIFNNNSITSKTLLVFATFINHWKAHIKESLPLFKLGYEAGIESGSFPEVAGNYIYESYSYFYITPELNSLEKRIAGYSQAIIKIQQGFMLNLNDMLRQVVLNLMGLAVENTRLIGEAYNEEESLIVYEQTNNIQSFSTYYNCKLFLYYLFENYQAALEASKLVAKYPHGVIAQASLPLYFFYDSLTQLAIYPTASAESQNLFWKKVEANQQRMQFWADHAPMNYLHKFYLVEAEKCRVLGKNLQAMDYYDQAILGAKENEYIQEEALAYELAGKFYQYLNKEIIAQAYLTKAYYTYIRWGSTAKARDLESKYPFLVIQQIKKSQIPSDVTRTSITTTSNGGMGSLLDLNSFVKASQAIISEIALDNLLTKLIHILLESAAAQKAVLLLYKDNQLVIEASGDHHDQIVTVLQSIPLKNSQDLPHSIINYVFQSQKYLVLDNAVAEYQSSDLYIQQSQLKSVLCLPIIYKSQLQGVIYLENRLTAAAFTPQRVEILKVLTSQIAIAIENAQLYAKEQEKSRQLTQSLHDLQQAQLQLIQSEKMSSIGNLVAGVAHEINNPVGFISSTVNQAQAACGDLIHHLQMYKRELLNPSQDIQEDASNIDVDFLIEDFPKMLTSMKVSCERIKNISNSLRTFSRGDTANKVLANIHDGLDSTLMILQHRLKANEKRPGIKIIRDYGDIPPVLCYLGQLNQVFMNILANAIDALEECNEKRSFAEIEIHPNIIIITTAFTELDHVLIKIKDNALGMTPEVQNQIFDHLFTTKPINKGTGLGLSISQQIIVDAHAGCLTCNSILGEGTEFIISIPIGKKW